MAIFNGTSGNDTINRSPDIEADVINGLAGNDTLIGGSGNDTIDGGVGIDSLAGGAGNDTYYVTGVYDDDLGISIFDKVSEDSVASSGIDTVIAGASANGYYLAKNVENLVLTAGILVHGNALNNVITGSASADVIEALAGNDTLLGGGGNDILAGGSGDDSIEGGDGNDNIWGDSNLTSSAGLTGNDILRGGAGNDSITSGAGNDSLYGDAGNDTLVAGTGNSTLYGGDGDDTYYINGTTFDDDGNYVHRDIISETATNGVDKIVITDMGLGRGQFVMPTNVENATLQVTGNVVGNRQNNLITANGGYSVLDGNYGNDTINGSTERDLISGGFDTDSINGGDGDDFITGDGGWIIAAGSSELDGNDTVRGGAGNDQIWGNNGGDALFGDAGDDLIYGGTAIYYIPDESDGNDTISGGSGNDSLNDRSTSSNEVYIWGRTQGADNLTDAGGTDRLDILPGVITNQVWLRRLGNNLEISVIGTTDSFTVNNWYASAANQVESIKLSDGKTLTSNKVDTLVNAMAAFTPPGAGQTNLPANYQAALNPVIAANWA